MMFHRTATVAFLILLSGGQLIAQVQQRSDKAFFAERRAAFEQTGAAPTVPPSLSSDPADPELVFLGYMPIATPEQEEEHFARLQTRRLQPASEAELTATLYDQEVATWAGSGTGKTTA